MHVSSPRSTGIFREHSRRHKKLYAMRTQIERIISRVKRMLSNERFYGRGRKTLQGFADRYVAVPTWWPTPPGRYDPLRIAEVKTMRSAGFFRLPRNRAGARRLTCPSPRLSANRVRLDKRHVLVYFVR